MSHPINRLVIDLSHHDPARDYAKVKAAGIVGVIYKATQGIRNVDRTYADQRDKAKAAGLLWGSYHFGDSSDFHGQVENYLTAADPTPDELFCLDFEPLDGSATMKIQQAVNWIDAVERKLGRDTGCVLYSGNLIKEQVLTFNQYTYLGARRLWLAQYGSNPVLPHHWDRFWLWQYTDGLVGPKPHSVDGVGNCDCNSYDGTPDELELDWA